MSGIEIVGLVLGAIPVLVGAAQVHKYVFTRVHPGAAQFYGQVLNDLNAEQVRLKSLCHNLLSGLVPIWELDEILQDPDSDGWKRYDQGIKLRLFRSNEVFKTNINMIHEAILELRKQLLVNELAKATNADTAFILKKFKERQAYVKRRAEFDRLLGTIIKCNNRLLQCVRENTTPDVDNRLVSESRLMPIMRKLYGDVFHALSDASFCDCEKPHDFSVEVEHKARTLVPEERESDATTDILVHVLFGSENAKEFSIPSTRRLADLKEVWHRQWVSLSVQEHPMPMEYVPEDKPEPRTGRVRFMNQFKRRVKLASQKEETFSPNPVTSPPRPPDIHSRLCCFLRESAKRREDCYGIVRNASKNFNVYARDDTKLHLSRPLSQFLRRTMESLPNGSFGLGDKLQAALDVSTAVMYLFDTPWLPEKLTLDDFLVLSTVPQPEGSRAQDTKNVKTFVKPVPASRGRLSTSQHKGHTGCSSLVPDLTVFSLGSLVTQILLGRVLDDLPSMIPEDEAYMYEHCQVGITTAAEVERELGNDCGEAVQWCFNHSKQITDGMKSRNTMRWLTFYKNVVLRLERGLLSFHDVGAHI